MKVTASINSVARGANVRCGAGVVAIIGSIGRGWDSGAVDTGVDQGQYRTNEALLVCP